MNDLSQFQQNVRILKGMSEKYKSKHQVTEKLIQCPECYFRWKYCHCDVKNPVIIIAAVRDKENEEEGGNHAHTKSNTAENVSL